MVGAAPFPALTILVPFFAGGRPCFTVIFLPGASSEARTLGFCFETEGSRRAPPARKRRSPTAPPWLPAWAHAMEGNPIPAATRITPATAKARVTPVRLAG